MAHLVKNLKAQLHRGHQPHHLLEKLGSYEWSTEVHAHFKQIDLLAIYVHEYISIKGISGKSFDDTSI